MSSKDAFQINMTPEDLQGLKTRLGQGRLCREDLEALSKVLQLVVTLQNLLLKRRLSILGWLRRIFGIKTEKHSSEKQHIAKPALSSGRRGRNGREDYPGAKKVHVAHECYKSGDTCPECRRGKLVEDKPAVDYDWHGQAPVTLHVYFLQRFLCHTCKTSFTATSPIAETAKTVDDSTDDEKVSRCNRNASANTMIALLRYMYGVACYRLAKIQGRLGIALAEATQHKMIQQVYEAARPVYVELIAVSAEGCLFHADDTAIKILDWLQGKGPPSQVSGKPHKKAQTSAILSKSSLGRTIVLYLTDEHPAGFHINNLLSKRESSSGSAIYMCDALSGNKVEKDFMVIQVYCLDHFRRQFYEIQSCYPSHCVHVLEELGKVYAVDAQAKAQGLNPEQRLDLHRQKSLEVMTNLGIWMQNELRLGRIEENSPLGKAMNYGLKRWTEFNEFLHTPGVPLSNSECERAIKMIITHRKNSLFYKTVKGAHVGDVIQSLIATCEQASINPFKYLTWLQENKAAVKKTPQAFLPWNMPA